MITQNKIFHPLNYYSIADKEDNNQDRPMQIGGKVSGTLLGGVTVGFLMFPSQENTQSISNNKNNNKHIAYLKILYIIMASLVGTGLGAIVDYFLDKSKDKKYSKENMN